ncbi:MAG TPA: hypothetical protein VGE02_01735 [Gemmatimonadales bacterium]
MTGQSLMHLAFFEALADETDDGSATWRETSAGLLVLRLFDGWIRALRRGEPGPEPSRVAAVRREVLEVEDGSTMRPVLLGLVDVIRAGGRDAEGARGHLLAYARRLQFDASWRLAADVYRTFVESRASGDVSAEGQGAAFQAGYCYRMAGDLDEAAVAYDVGEAIATAAHDVDGMLRARVCKVKLTTHRGNLPRAEAELDAIIRTAEEAGSRPALSLALTDRMAVAGQRGRYEEAATFGWRALQCCDDDLERERILGDIATALGDAGHRGAAYDAHTVLSITARDRSVGWLATVNLLEMAVADGLELDFERHRRAVADVPLPAAVRAKYHLTVGDGFRRFGRPGPAAAAYRQAIVVAEEHQVNEILLRAEAALRELEAVAPAPAERDTGSGVTIADVISAMRRLREEAGAGV